MIGQVDILTFFFFFFGKMTSTGDQICDLTIMITLDYA